LTVATKGTNNAFDSLWARFMSKALTETALVERFQERDLRAKSASDEDSLEAASKRLGHTQQEITKLVYRRKGEVVQPLKRPKKLI